jgi:propanol-preferring alcohol dehydrogenase
MKAVVVEEFKKRPQVKEVAEPKIRGPFDALVRIHASGVCHTDLHAADGDWPVKPKPPFIPGHEGVGHVAALGAGVTHIKEGDRVGVPWLYTACGHCRHCLGGWETLCESQQNTGYSVNGGFAEYVLADPNYVGHLPAKASFVDIAPILCAGVTVYKGLKVTDTRPGDWIVVSGIGGLGHMAVSMRSHGLNVIAVDVDDSKLELATRLGAALVVNARKADPMAFVKKEVGGAQGVLVTAVSPKAFEQAMGMVGRGGTVSLVGLPPGDFPLSIFNTVLNGVTVRGSIVGTRLDLQEALDFAGQGKVKATVAAERLENINQIFARMRAGDIQGRIVIDFRNRRLHEHRCDRHRGPRPPVGAFQGELRAFRVSARRAGHPRGVGRARVHAQEVDGVIMGCVLPAGRGRRPPARRARRRSAARDGCDHRQQDVARA